MTVRGKLDYYVVECLLGKVLTPSFFRLYIYLELGEDEKTEGKLTKKLFKVSQSDSGSCKIPIRRDVTPDAGGDRKKKPHETEGAPLPE